MDNFLIPQKLWQVKTSIVYYQWIKKIKSTQFDHQCAVELAKKHKYLKILTILR